MKISDLEMKRRIIIGRLQSRITDVIGEFVTDDIHSISFVEIMHCLHEAMGRSIKEMLHEEWKEADEE